MQTAIAPHELFKQRKLRYQRIEAALCDTLEPQDYAEKWIPKLFGLEAEERGFRDKAVTEIARITGLSAGSVNNWGSKFERSPDYVKRMLKMADILNTVTADWQGMMDS